MVEYEADDALAAAAAVADRDERVEQVLIVTPDKDLGQCVRGERVVQFDRRKREIIDADGVRAKFGVGPESIADYLGLVGDTADGFPGLPGMGREERRSGPRPVCPHREHPGGRRPVGRHRVTRGGQTVGDAAGATRRRTALPRDRDRRDRHRRGHRRRVALDAVPPRRSPPSPTRSAPPNWSPSPNASRRTTDRHAAAKSNEMQMAEQHAAD